jgi:hypothetical protein
VIANRLESLVVLAAVLLEEVRQIQDRLVKNAALGQEKGDEQATDKRALVIASL